MRSVTWGVRNKNPNKLYIMKKKVSSEYAWINQEGQSKINKKNIEPETFCKRKCQRENYGMIWTRASHVSRTCDKRAVSRRACDWTSRAWNVRAYSGEQKSNARIRSTAIGVTTFGKVGGTHTCVKKNYIYIYILVYIYIYGTHIPHYIQKD